MRRNRELSGTKLGKGGIRSPVAATQDRLSGILLHVTSLPSYGGVGDFGPAAYAFVDFLAAAKQRLWQVLPLSPPGYGTSPHSAPPAFPGDPPLTHPRRPAPAAPLTPPPPCA